VQTIPARPRLADHGTAPHAVPVPEPFEVSGPDPVIR
jgi:hypothetical protein